VLDGRCRGPGAFPSAGLIIYLDSSDSLSDLAMKAGSPERESLYTAIGQVTATQAVAAALERLAEAVENLAGQAAQGKT
jgi:hypothetical protein